MKTYQQKYEEEMKAHQETISRFQDDKKKVLMSTEDANRNLVKGCDCSILLFLHLLHIHVLIVEIWSHMLFIKCYRHAG